MTDIDPATLPNFPLEDATDWIGRWKEAGGGFFCRAQDDQVQVQLAWQGDSEIMPAAAQSLQTELLITPALKSAVTTLVANSWAKARDVANMTPEGNA